jgi:hypothetical protein
MQRTAILPLAFAAAATLAGCDLATTQAAMQGLTWNTVTADVSRASEEAFAELPFTRGPISVIWPGDDGLRSARLYPCQSSEAICLNSPHGPASAVERTDRHFILAFGDGRTFFLRPGGEGTLRSAQGDIPLAWNAYVNGVPVYPQPDWPYSPWITQVEPGPNP